MGLKTIADASSFYNLFKNPAPRTCVLPDIIISQRELNLSFDDPLAPT
jgi:hypothetical protein